MRYAFLLLYFGNFWWLWSLLCWTTCLKCLGSMDCRTVSLLNLSCFAQYAWFYIMHNNNNNSNNQLCRRPPQYAPAPSKLTFDLLTLKVVSESRVTWATSVPILVFLALSVLDLGPMYATDRQASVRQTSDVHHRLMPSRAGHNKNCCNVVHYWLLKLGIILWIHIVSEVDCKAGYRCGSGECIDGNLLCDKEWNCRDGSDELRCRLSGTHCFPE